MGFFSDNIPNDPKAASKKAEEIMDKLIASVKNLEKKKYDEANYQKNMEATQNYYFDHQKNI